jgi:hypothetical protein
MIVETVKTYSHWARDNIVTKQYITEIDKSNKRVLTVIESSYMPYSIRGEQQKDDTKGKHIDVKV